MKTAEQLDGRRDLIRALAFCFLAVVVVRSFLFEPFKIPSSSMVPTLKIGDHIFVSKFNYGLSIPFTKELISWSSPKRGEVVVFVYPKDEALHYIKRVVGVPGDTVEFRGRELYINGQAVPKEPISDAGTIKKIIGSEELQGVLYREEINGISHTVKYSRGVVDDFPRNRKPEVIPKNMFFMVGDNRDDSYDSRSWGYVPRENIIGKAQIVWLSLDKARSWGTLGYVRWGRCGTLIR